MAEILVTVELGKVVLVDEKTNRVKSLKPLAWRPAQVVSGSVIARERQRVGTSSDHSDRSFSADP